MIIRFLPFVNDKNAQAWRTKLEQDFLAKSPGLTDDVNAVRTNRGAYGTDQAYYKALHEKKRVRQRAWLEFLVEETNAELIKALEALKTRKEDNCDIIVGALPEFFWVDINDNEKHTVPSNDPSKGEYIVGYHKPLYDEVFNDVLCNAECVLQKIVDNNPKLILFAGTAMTKKINEADHTQEEIYNTLLIYRGGESLVTWKKQHISGIDGFYNRTGAKKKNKIGAGDDTTPPICKFGKVSFAYDICRDFWDGGGHPKDGECQPLSSLLGKDMANVNVLIAAGMPLTGYVKLNIQSLYVLRCDGIHDSNESGATVVKWDETSNQYEITNIFRMDTGLLFGVSESIDVLTEQQS